MGVLSTIGKGLIKKTSKDSSKEVANLAKGGMVKNQGIGASMKPHNMFGKKK